MKIIGDRYQVISERTERSTLIYHVQNQRSNNNSSALRAPNQKIQNSEDLESRFKSACHALQAVRHENVLTALYFHDSGDLEDTCYLETEWFEESLRDVMDREDFAPHTKQTILVKLLSGVQAIHQSGMALGEFGPDLVHVDSICSTVKVGPSEKWLPLDSDDISLTPDISQYAAPELLEGLPDINKQRADVYAVGMFAYEFLLGRQQFQRTFSDIYNDPNADFNELWYNWQTDKTRIAEVLSDQDESIDPVLSAAVEWMIEKNPENRCPDISSALKQVSDRGPRGGLDIPPVPPPPPTSSDDFIDEASEPWWKWPLSETKNLIITVSVAVLLIVILAFWAAQPTAIGIKEDAVAKSNEYKAVKEQIDTLPDEAIKHLANKEAAAVKKWNIAIQFYEELNYTGSIQELEQGIQYFNEIEIEFRSRIFTEHQQQAELQKVRAEEAEATQAETFKQASALADEAKGLFDSENYDAAIERLIDAADLFSSAYTDEMNAKIGQQLKFIDELAKQSEKLVNQRPGLEKSFKVLNQLGKEIEGKLSEQDLQPVLQQATQIVTDYQSTLEQGWNDYLKPMVRVAGQAKEEAEAVKGTALASYKGALQQLKQAEQNMASGSSEKAAKLLQQARQGFIQSVLEQRTQEARQEATQARSVAIEKGFSREHETFVSGQDHYDSAQNHADEEQYEDSIRAFVRATIAFKALKKLDPEVLARRPIEFTVGVTEQDRKLALQVCNQANGDCAKLNFSRETARNVSIAPFGIDQNEISNIQFAQFVKETRYLTQAERQGFTFGLESGALIKVAGLNWRQPLQGVEVSVQEIPNHPVVNLTRVEAQAYCEWDKKRLPSEEEWEFVARGVDQRRLYSWGNGWQQASTEAEFALGVGSNPADMTPERVFDLSGNVKEWTSSNDGDSAIVRGGSWIDNGINRSRLSFRHTVSSELPMQDVGFRCAKTIEKWGGTGS